jgi:2-polyprenyl-3-methyl-5-hydroxy-6-metoxy-1,4-benzoquinol methylase
LAEKGYAMTGVDLSEEMLAVANSQLSTAIQQGSLNSQPPSLNFLQGDIRTVRLGKAFDVVVSLFHVVSYQTTNKDLTDAFATARAHLHRAEFHFDRWYGPAVRD